MRYSWRNRMFLGIDQSFTSAGYCIIDDRGEVVRFGTCKTNKTEGDIFDRSHMVSKFMVDLILEIKPTLIGLEGLAFGGVGNATRDLAGLQHVLVTRIRYGTQFGDNLVIVPPTDLKKCATGKGKAKKEDMAAALPEQLKCDILEKNYRKSTGLYDIADAYWIAQYILNKNRTIHAHK